MRFKHVWVGMVGLVALVGAVDASAQQAAPKATAPSTAAATADKRALLDKYCVGCHNARVQNGKMRLDNADIATVGEHGEIWERVVRKIRGGVMPPPGAPRPEKVAYEGFASWLESQLDAAAVKQPNPGRTQSLHRLNRTEYGNIVRDVLGMEMDFTELLPIDDSGGGESAFDNIASSLRLTQTLLEQYLSVAAKVSRTAVGGNPPPVELEFKAPPAQRQDVYIDGMPFGTRGGTRFTHIFPVDGEYEFEIGTGAAGKIDFAIDGEQIKLFEFAPKPRPVDYDGMAAPVNNNIFHRMLVKAGPHEVTGAYLKTGPTLKIEGDRTPYYGGDSNGGGTAFFRSPGVSEIIVRGPLKVTGKGDTPSRRKIFTCRPAAATAAAEEDCAKTILGKVGRKLYRRPLSAHDVEVLMAQYKEGRADADFEGGVERGIRTMLVNPNFLFRVVADPAKPGPGGVYRISDVDLASRIAFFIWSSAPDDELLNLAVSGQLRAPGVVEKQVKRMLADPRSESLTRSFASQWLWVRNIKASLPSEPIFPNFDETLRQAFQKEIEMFFSAVVREDRSAVDLLDGDFTFLNDRLAKHYGIAGVYGTDFRRVQLPADSPRRGLLGKGLLLLVTSRSTRTSPVVRGKWILENLLGTPPPAPPANVPPLPEQKQADGRVLTVRELMAKHRANPVCASCHNNIDPAGFALEQFDGIGKWRLVDAGFQPIDASGTLPDGTKFSGINDFRALMLSKKEQFVKTMSNKLMMYALGRGTEYYDAPAVRKVVADAAASNYRFSAIVTGIVKSVPFQMRKAAAVAPATQSASLAR
jgi:mono/diheme cytochrome c family protein